MLENFFLLASAARLAVAGHTFEKDFFVPIDPISDKQIFPLECVGCSDASDPSGDILWPNDPGVEQAYFSFSSTASVMKTESVSASLTPSGKEEDLTEAVIGFGVGFGIGCIGGVATGVSAALFYALKRTGFFSSHSNMSDMDLSCEPVKTLSS